MKLLSLLFKKSKQDITGLFSPFGNSVHVHTYKKKKHNKEHPWPQLSPVVRLMFAGAIKQTQNNNKHILLKCLAKWNQNSHSSLFHKYIN